ncbi:MAG: 2-C-methyl-D-erythritol 4-phosphate cytidylyltransferase [Phycisphaerales bacterium]|nr:2-C-methyl-D-erythritol 4-phosphate cytidylyltransferase [Phycisphaerales bacterium]
MNISVILPAAGSGRRFGGSDKLGQDLGGRALLLRTVELFTKREEVRSIIVAAPPDSFDEFQSRYGATLSFHGVQIVPGGRIERWETVRNAIAAVPAEATHIAVHDAARPAAPPDLIDRVFEAAKLLPAVIPGLAITATVKRIGDEAVSAVEEDPVADLILGDAGRQRTEARAVAETVDRRGLVAVQTPQVFAAELLRRAYAQADLDGVTDDASVVERIGEPVYVVEGDPRNLKVTTQADLDMVRSILKAPPPAERPVHKRF